MTRTYIHGRAPSSAPDADYEVANKKYVDDVVAGDIAYTQTTTANWTLADASSIKLTLDEVATRLVAMESIDHDHSNKAVLDAITTKSRAIRLPAHIVSLKLRVFRFTENFLLSMGFEPDVELIAKELKVDKYQVEKVLSITTEHTGDWEPIEECTIEEELEQENALDNIVIAIRTLSLKEQLILGMKF